MGEHDAVGSRRMLAQPEKTELDRRMGLGEPVELSLQGGHVGRARGLGPRARDEGHVVHRDGMDPCQLLGHLAWERRSCPRQLGSPDDAPADALARDARHDERFTPAQVLEVAVRPWNADARGICRLEDAVLVVERERVVEDRSAHRTADQQGEPSVGGRHVHGPRLLGRASREQRGRRDLDTAAQQVREAIPEVFCERRKEGLSLGAARVSRRAQFGISVCGPDPPILRAISARGWDRPRPRWADSQEFGGSGQPVGGAATSLVGRRRSSHRICSAT